MREELKKLNGKNRTFIATVGIKGSYLGNDNITHRTVCLENVYLKDSILLTDHVWVSKNNNLKGLIKGQKIQFKGLRSCEGRRERSSDAVQLNLLLRNSYRLSVGA